MYKNNSTQSITGYLVIDIETIPNQTAEKPVFDPASVKVGNLKDPAKVQEKIDEARIEFESGLTKRMSVESSLCEIVSLGYIELDRFLGEKRRGTFYRDEDGDKCIIDGFLGIFKGQRLITWNGKHFDVPVIWKRSIAHNIAVFRDYLALTNKYRHDEHIDLMHVFNNYDMGKLIDCARFLGLPAKEGLDGSMIYDAWLSGRHDDIRAYNMQDCETTLAIAERLKMISAMEAA